MLQTGLGSAHASTAGRGGLETLFLNRWEIIYPGSHGSAKILPSTVTGCQVHGRKDVVGSKGSECRSDPSFTTLRASQNESSKGRPLISMRPSEGCPLSSVHSTIEKTRSVSLKAARNEQSCLPTHPSTVHRHPPPSFLPKGCLTDLFT